MECTSTVEERVAVAVRVVVTEWMLVTAESHDFLCWFGRACLISQPMSRHSTRRAGHLFAMMDDEARIVIYPLFERDECVHRFYINIAISRAVLCKLSLVMAYMSVSFH